MNTRAITVLSLVGVLAAGSAAAMVNTRVLTNDNSIPRSEAVLSVTGITTPAPAAQSAAAPVSGITGGTTPMSSSATYTSQQFRALTAATLAPPTLKASAVTTSSNRQLSAYQLGDAGLIRIDSGSSEFRVAEVSPNPGWTVVSVTPGSTSDTAEVVLRSGDVEVTFVAQIVGGKIVTSVSSRALSSSSGGGGASSSQSPGDDDDQEEVEDDDDHEDDDHDEDEEDDDHEDDDHEDDDHEDGHGGDEDDD